MADNKENSLIEENNKLRKELEDSKLRIILLGLQVGSLKGALEVALENQKIDKEKFEERSKPT